MTRTPWIAVVAVLVLSSACDGSAPGSEAPEAPVQVVPALNTCDYGRLYPDGGSTLTLALGSGSHQFLTCAQMATGGPWREVDGEIDLEGEAAVEAGGRVRTVCDAPNYPQCVGEIQIVATWRGVSSRVPVLVVP